LKKKLLEPKSLMKDDYGFFFDKALKFLSYRPRSEFEVSRYLIEKGVPQDILEKILARLKELEFIDDQVFCEWWIEQRSRTNVKGIKLIKAELKQKGIPAEVIDSQLQKNRPGNSDVELAEKVIQKKLSMFKGVPDFEVRNKIYRALIQRGFAFEIAKKAVDKAFEKE
jgi:regulatory protein